MANFNKVILLGNLTRDPQLKYLPSQMAVVDFGLAVNHKYKTSTGEDREEVCFIDCTAFGKGAEVINQYCQKGKQLLVEGRLKYETWEDKQGGGKRSKHKITVDSFQLLGGRDNAGGGAPAGGEEGGQAAPQRAPAARRPAPGPQQPSPISEESQVNPDDIPF
jgi:single-strand DNA-binding protein